MSKKLIEMDGLPVLDAKKPLRLEVMREDIRDASKKVPNSCAVAKACTRAMGVKGVKVHVSRLYLNTNDKSWTRYVVSGAMRNEIIAYDRGGKFMPGVYVLNAPQKCKRLGVKQTDRKRGARPEVKNPAKKLRAYSHVTNVRATITL